MHYGSYPILGNDQQKGVTVSHNPCGPINLTDIVRFVNECQYPIPQERALVVTVQFVATNEDGGSRSTSSPLQFLFYTDDRQRTRVVWRWINHCIPTRLYLDGPTTWTSLDTTDGWICELNAILEGNAHTVTTLILVERVVTVVPVAVPMFVTIDLSEVGAAQQRVSFTLSDPEEVTAIAIAA